MKSKLNKSFFLILCLFSSCAGITGEKNRKQGDLVPFAAYKQQSANVPFTILDYERKNEGQGLPDWASAWINGGIAAVEKMPLFQDKYCFVLEQNNTDFETLLRWSTDFSIERNFSNVVLQRIFQRWTLDITVSPDRLYGSYFVKMLKACASSFRPGVQNAGMLWLFIRYNTPETAPGPDDLRPPSGETYRIIILAVVDKTRFQNELSSTLSGIEFEKTDTRAQTNAVEQVLGNFWPRF